MNKEQAKTVDELVSSADKVLIIQAENPDGDSLGSALALEQILGDMGKEPYLYCPVQIPGYLRYMEGWSRVAEEFPREFDLAIIVDTSTATLLERALVPENLSALASKPALVLDHHNIESDLPFDATIINDPNAVATGELIYELASKNSWNINQEAKKLIAISILADSLGLMSEGTTPRTVEIIAQLVGGGVKLHEIDDRRRQYNKKSEDIFRYKGQLFERVEFHLNNSLGLVIIPWEDIQKYSDAYNPSMLILDEIRMVDGVQIAAAFKMYPDGKITCKLRSNSGGPQANKIAEHFGGGGHPYAAGFKVRNREFTDLKKEFLTVAREQIETA